MPGVIVCAKFPTPGPAVDGLPVNPPNFFGWFPPLLIAAHFYERELFKAENDELRLFDWFAVILFRLFAGIVFMFSLFLA